MQASSSRAYTSPDTLMLATAGLYSVVLLVLGMRFNTFETAAFGAVGAMAAAIVLWATARDTRVALVGFPVVLMSLVALQIQVSAGQMQYHFGVFLTLAFLLAYRQALPVLAGAVTIAVHHVLFDYLQSQGYGLFCLQKPDFAQIVEHALYVVAQTGIELFIVAGMQRDRSVLAEFEAVTFDLTRNPGMVNFAGVPVQARTPEGQALCDALHRVAQSVASVKSCVSATDDASRTVLSDSQQITTSADRAGDQLSQVTSAVQELHASVSSTAAMTKTTYTAARDSANAASRGAVAVREVSDTMTEIAKDSSRISAILELVESVSFQTNILALNAAVEAARAGEHGRGFSVVAAEVRALSKKTADATNEIKQIVAKAITRASQGQERTTATAALIEEIAAGISTVNELAGSLSQGAAAQASALSQISASVQELEAETLSNAKLAGSSLETAKSLADHSRTLSQALEPLHLPRAA